jgi:DNA-binding NarL/FixJ family response regulator
MLANVVVRGVELELPLRVLLVDDVAAFRAVARAYLQEIGDVTLIGEASCGDEALIQLDRLQPDLVLMDVHMKRGNGLDTARRIKAKAKHPLVVLFSLQSDDAMRRAAIASGADDFFSKSDFLHGVACALERIMGEPAS